MPGSDATARAGTSFHEAIAQWRLQVRTEVKKASALPTAMFDACDPMLETRLCESVEAMLGQLQEPPAHVAEAPGEQRLETIREAELKALPAQLVGDEVAGEDLGAGTAAEYLAVLADTCCTATGHAQQQAVRRLVQDFGADPDQDFTALLRLLLGEVDAATAPSADSGTADDLAVVCRQLTAAIALHGRPPEGSR